jgi:hypothetical protein
VLKDTAVIVVHRKSPLEIGESCHGRRPERKGELRAVVPGGWYSGCEGEDLLWR